MLPPRNRRLTLNLGANINFISGPNGSGKSAILAAIMLGMHQPACCTPARAPAGFGQLGWIRCMRCAGLGGNAASTGRGAPSAKDFIRKGEDLASIRISLRNEGVMAYRPDAYGRLIYIEREIKKNGASRWASFPSLPSPHPGS